MLPVSAIAQMPPTDDQGLINVVVETPRGSRQKYDLDHETGLFHWSLELPAALAFPFSFGFVPGTLGADGDPLDVLLLLDGAVPPGVVVASRLIGVLEMKQDEGGEKVRNDRLIAVANLSRAYAGVDCLDRTRDGFGWDMEQFFLSYNRMIQRDIEVLGFGDAKSARTLLARGRR